MSKRHNCSSCLHWEWSPGEDIGRCERPGGPIGQGKNVILQDRNGRWLSGCSAKCDGHERHPEYGNFEDQST